MNIIRYIHKSQLSDVLKYVKPHTVATPFEKILFFEDVSVDHSTNALAEIVEKTIISWNCTGKLIAQTYDEAVVMARELNRMQKNVNGIFPAPIFIHYCTYTLNFVLSRSVSLIKECKIYLQLFLELVPFFLYQPSETLLLAV